MKYVEWFHSGQNDCPCIENYHYSLSVIELTGSTLDKDVVSRCVSHAVTAIYPELRSHCPGWPGICWCWRLPSACCLWCAWHRLSRCLPGLPGGSCSASHVATPHLTVPVAWKKNQNTLLRNQKRQHHRGVLRNMGGITTKVLLKMGKKKKAFEDEKKKTC